MIVRCAECDAEHDIHDARGPDSAGDFHCTDPYACAARALELEATYGI